jgi:hypothetical protein
MPEKRFDALKIDLTGDVSVEVKDADDTPNDVLPLNKDWSVDVDWHLKGQAVDAIDGDWILLVSMESMGEGYEGPIHAQEEIELEAQEADSTNIDRHWKRTVKADRDIPNKPGVYKVVALVSYQTEQDHPLPMAGFAEADLISFYTSA